MILYDSNGKAIDSSKTLLELITSINNNNNTTALTIIDDPSFILSLFYSYNILFIKKLILFFFNNRWDNPNPQHLFNNTTSTVNSSILFSTNRII